MSKGRIVVTFNGQSYENAWPIPAGLMVKFEREYKTSLKDMKDSVRFEHIAYMAFLQMKTLGQIPRELVFDDFLDGYDAEFPDADDDEDDGPSVVVEERDEDGNPTGNPHPPVISTSPACPSPPASVPVNLSPMTT